MNYIESNNLAIVACPGGEKFADLTIENLRHIYARKFYQQRDKLAKRYSIEKEKITENFNLYRDMALSRMSVNKDIDKFHLPKFKVDARFTYFMNGEFKTEILETIRGKDVYIFQDVENKEEITINEGKNKLYFSVNDHLMSLIVTIDAVRHAGADRISLVLPDFTSPAMSSMMRSTLTLCGIS